MFSKKTSMIAASLWIGQVWPATPITLPERLQVAWLNGPDAMATISYCVTDFTQEKLEDLRRKAENASVVMQREGRSASPYLLASGDRVACIDRNGPAKPLLPPKLFSKIITVDGASAQTRETLYRGLAEQLATRGSASGLIKFTNGNAYEVIVTAVDDAPIDLAYSANFIKVGEYDETKYGVVVADQIRSVGITSFNGGRRMLNILLDEFAQRPMFGEFLQISGNSETGRYPFGGSTWAFSGGSLLQLQADGTAIMKPKNGSELKGTWQLRGDALYFHYGKIYASAALRGQQLHAEFRALPISEMGQERRWNVTLEKN